MYPTRRSISRDPRRVEEVSCPTQSRAGQQMTEGSTPVIDRDRVDLCLADALDEARRAFETDPLLLPLLDRIGTFVLERGERLRPRLCLAIYRIVSGRSGPPPGSVLRQIAGSRGPSPWTERVDWISTSAAGATTTTTPGSR